MGINIYKYKSIQDVILGIECEYQKSIQEYRDQCILQERHNTEFLNSDKNIFNSIDHPILMELINDYREIKKGLFNRNYKQAQDLLVSLKDRVKEHYIGINRRAGQIEDRDAVSNFKSEMYFLTDFIFRLEMTIELIGNCLVPLEDYAADRAKAGFEISQDEDYELFLVNKCLVLYRTALFDDECIEILEKLTKRLCGRKFYSKHMLFRVGTLNIQYRLYEHAERIFGQLIEKLRNEASSSTWDNEEKRIFFSSYMMLVSSYEYSGQYNKALATLIGEPLDEDPLQLCKHLIEKVINTLSKAEKSINDLVFASNDEESRQRVVGLLRRILITNTENNLFNGEIAQFAYANGEIFYRITQKENNEITKYIQNLYRAKGETRDDITEKAVQKHIQSEEKNKPLHDYLHLLAHCLNEEAVLILKRRYPDDKDIYRNLIILSRAIMLLVAEDEETYIGAHAFKTCLATVYAEAGEFHLASQNISEIIQDPEQYSGMDVVSKAEIDFFYYLLPRINAISSTNPISNSYADKYYNHYLNCCYRNFDFDAISHISLLSFEYRLAILLQSGDLARISEEFYEQVSADENNLEDNYNAVINIKNLDAHNIWLKNERHKVRYIYEFLKLYLQHDKDGNSLRSPRLYEMAYQYLKINHCFGQDTEISEIQYIDFDCPQNAIKLMTELFDGARLSGECADCVKGGQNIELTIGNVKLILADHWINKKDLDRTSLYFIFNGVICDSVADEDTAKHHSLSDELNKDIFLERIQFFDTPSKAIKEFFLLCTFMMIRADFVNPSRIFIMTPVNNAEPCKFPILDDLSLIHQNYDSNAETANFESLNAQYALSLNRSPFLCKKWLARLVHTSNTWLWALTFVLEDGNPNDMQYTIYFPDKQSTTAKLYHRAQCENILNHIFRPQRIIHTKNKKQYRACNADPPLCHIWKTERILDAKFKELFKSFPEIAWKQYAERHPNGSLLFWKKNESNRYVVWRIVLTNNSRAEKDAIMQTICNEGLEYPFVKRNPDSAQEWPIPYDALQKNEPFLFICHLGKTDDVVKFELNSFFEAERIRYWYDHEMILGDDWLKMIRTIISKDTCVGCIMLITCQEFFESESINREFEELIQKKHEKSQFAIVPVVYNCYRSDDLLKMAKKAYEMEKVSLSQHQICLELLGLSPHKTKGNQTIFLNDLKGGSLQEYTDNEKDKGRRTGAILHMCNELNVIKEKL